MVSKNARILILGGAGTMGSSTALHLARRGYTDVRILDPFQPPSANSAGNDMNKLISTQYADGVWGRLGDETWDAWSSDELFAPYLRPVGRVDLASTGGARCGKLQKQFELSKQPGREHPVEWLDNEARILEKAPYLKGAAMQDWQGIWVRDAGWVAARDALAAVGKELARLGVKSAFGTAGTFKELLLHADGTTCVGVKAVDGTEWQGDLVILACGAWSPTLLDLQGQCVSKCWQYGHIQLAPEEAKEMRSTATLYNAELGFFMEPSPQGVMKFVNEFEGYTHMASCRPFGADQDMKISVPRSHAIHPTDTIPTEGVEAIRQVIETCLPRFKHKTLFDTAICWCTDSFDGNWLLCQDPRYQNLILATGDSGHTFKMLPIVGKYVADLVEGRLSDEDRHRWRWRPEDVGKVRSSRDGPRPKDLADVDGWNHDGHTSEVNGVEDGSKSE